METMFDVEIDVTKLAPAREGENKTYCLQGWVNLKHTGNPQGLNRYQIAGLSDEGKKHVNFGESHFINGFTYHDFKASDDHGKWPTIQEFHFGTKKLMEKMSNKDYAGVQEQLASYASVGVNFIPVNLPKE